jgi:S1-C subfamily serine protease
LGFRVFSLGEDFNKQTESIKKKTLVLSWAVTNRTDFFSGYSQEVTIVMKDYNTRDIVYKGVGDYMGRDDLGDKIGAIKLALEGLSEYKPVISDKDAEEELYTQETEAEGGVGTGTGFFIGSQGYLVTNHHVVEHRNKFFFYQDKEVVELKLIAVDKANDLALLKSEKVPEVSFPVATDIVPAGESVITFGYPNIALQGLEMKSTFGHVNSQSGFTGDVRYYQVDTPIQPGNSGGPVINHYGEVVGVITSMMSLEGSLATTGQVSQNVNYALKTPYLMPMLMQYGIKNEIDPEKRKKMEPVELINKFKQSAVLVISKSK